MTPRTVWLRQSFNGFGAFAASADVALDEFERGMQVRAHGRLFVVPWSNVAGVEYSTSEATVPPVSPPVGGAVPPPVEPPKTVPAGRRR